VVTVLVLAVVVRPAHLTVGWVEIWWLDLPTGHKLSLQHDKQADKWGLWVTTTGVMRP
jgi:hypothetical protein